MIFPDEYVARAEHNEETYVYLAQSAPLYNDWQITVLLYAAVHYVNAFLGRSREPIPATHGQRDQVIIDNPNLLSIWPDYHELRTRSQDARYKFVRLPSADRLYEERFAPLRTHLRSQLGLPD